MTANGFEIDVPKAAEGTNDIHQNFVAEYMNTQESGAHNHDSSSEKEHPLEKKSEAGSITSTLADELSDRNTHQSENRMDGKPLYGDKPGQISGGVADHIQEAIKGLENITRPEGNKIIDDFDKSEMIKKLRPVSDKDREAAADELEGEIPEIVDDAAKKRMVAIQEALINGDMEDLNKALRGSSKDGKDMGKFVNELNRQLEELGSSTELVATKDGRVFVHDGSSDLAVQLNPDGSQSVRAVERTESGAIVVNPGEVINRSVDEVAGSIGDNTTRDITAKEFDFKPIHKPIYKPGIIDKLEGMPDGRSDKPAEAQEPNMEGHKDGSKIDDLNNAERLNREAMEPAHRLHEESQVNEALKKLMEEKE